MFISDLQSRRCRPHYPAMSFFVSDFRNYRTALYGPCSGDVGRMFNEIAKVMPPQLLRGLKQMSTFEIRLGELLG